MKIITECVISIKTLEVISEKSYEYEGPITECKGGGGSSSGKVDYPEHMKVVQADWLYQSGSDHITMSMTDVMNAALGSSPWIDQVAYDTDNDVAAMIEASDDLQTLVSLLSSNNSLDSIMANVLDDSYIDNVVNEYAEDLDARLESETLPRFEAGMRDINAVMSSAFAIGRAIIEENQDRQVAKFAADLHMRNSIDNAIRVVGLKLEYQKIASAMTIEAHRLKIVSKKEEYETNMTIDEKDALWDLQVFQHGANLLASIGGGVAVPGGGKGPSQLQSAVGGALSGAAAGAMVGSAVPGIGTVTGAIVGGVLGAGSAFL